ncbi:glycoside hydrolase/deacetylase [Piromyces finnis]|uniref:Glycoside hydrolase/deacetylase n=1 Tax=Piromyces finnis TaxID=1754191 RepID=A0A1Y1V737_9FUNG|nr:glycoside hydrolase/deacetylase [Piromyces finnis]|eukprot:ORX47587.1 glycoside hydrolase/deacetylase [Piromyces finnis]
MNSVRGDVKYFSKCINEGDFAITFDDGPNLDYTNMILDILDEFDVKATFFVNGKNCVNITANTAAQKIIKREYESGHTIGSHTFTHPFGITNLTDDELTYQLDELNKVLYDLIGVKPAFFRPPLGEYSEANLKIIEKSGFTANILWNLDSEDWDVNYNATQQYIDNLEGKDPNSHSWISLNHDIQKVTAEKNLRIVIPYIKKLGYNIVPMDVCIGLPAYQNEKTQDSKTTTKIIKTTTTTTTTKKRTTTKSATTTTTKNEVSKEPNSEIVVENPQNLNANTVTTSTTVAISTTTNTASSTNNENTNTNDTVNGNITISNDANNDSSDATTIKTSIIFSSAFMIMIAYLFL